jgi:hypothetical protein
MDDMSTWSSIRRALQRLSVAALEVACRGIDGVVYRPAVVKLGMPMPRWWNCELARLSVRLDDRWGTGHWHFEPGGLCDACGRRAAWLDWWDPEDEDRTLRDYSTCYWCRPPDPIGTNEELDLALAEARRQSVSWRWRWPVPRTAYQGRIG